LTKGQKLRGAQLHRYIRDQLYWVLHAPRQTGKTTLRIRSEAVREEGIRQILQYRERCLGVEME
jgi:hypothetical protein